MRSGAASHLKSVKRVKEKRKGLPGSQRPGRPYTFQENADKISVSLVRLILFCTETAQDLQAIPAWGCA
jgi:hypothetical protein